MHRRRWPLRGASRFNLNLSSVLFSSEIPQSSNRYKLTLKDSNLSISVTNGTVVTRNGSTVSIPYTNSSGTKAYVMVTDKAYTESGASVLYYAELATGGTGTFTIDGSWGTDYKVYLLAVNKGGDMKTDTASAPVEITIPTKSDQTVTAPTAVSNLTYTGSAQTLISAGTAENGTMKYAVTTENTKPADTAYTFTDSSLPTGTDAKTYYVWYRSIGNEGYNDYDGSSSVSVTIAPADPEKPKDLKATYGDTLADVTLPSGWAWTDSSASVGDAGTKTFKANYTSPDTNHNSKQGEDLSVTVGKADNTAKITNTAEVVQGGNTVYLSGNVTDAVGSISYAISGETNGCSLSGSVLTSGENTGSCTVTVTAAGDTNYKEVSADITVSIIEKTTAPNTTPPVAADGWTEDGTEHVLLKSAGASDGGTYWYNVNNDGWTSDPDSLKAITAGTYSISYYIKGTGIYKDNGSETAPLGPLTVIVEEKGTPQLTVEPEGASGLEANGSMQDLLQTAGAADGGTVMYSVNGGAWSDAVPQASEAGEYLISYYIKGDSTHVDSGTPEKPLGTLSVLIAEVPMDVKVDFVFVKYDGRRGVPFDIKEGTLSPVITLKKGDEAVSKSGSVKVEIKAKAPEVSLTVTFSKKLADLGPGKYAVVVSGLPKEMEKEVPDAAKAPKYKLTAKAEINKKGGITVYLIWDDGNRPEEPVVYPLPEDEIGAYTILDDGTKEYLLFHTYDICMRWLGWEDLCRDNHHSYQKELPYLYDKDKPEIYE